MGVDTVVLAVDRDDADVTEELTDAAVDVAGDADATVALACVYGSEEYATSREQLQFGADSEVTPDAIAARNVAVRGAEERLAGAGVGVETVGQLADGAPSGECLAEIAAELEADMLLIGGRDRSPVGKAVFGSTAQTAMLNAPCPVTFVRAD